MMRRGLRYLKQAGHRDIMADQKIEIELEIRDKASEAIQHIAGNLKDILKQFAEFGSAHGDTSNGIQHSVRSVKQLGDTSKETQKSLSSMASTLTMLGRAGGVVGLIGSGLVAAAVALDSVAGKNLRLQNLSQDIGFAVDDISVMEQTFRRMGMTSEEAQAHIVTLGRQLKNLATYGEGSDMFRQLTAMGRGEIAKQLLESVKADKFYEAFKMANEEARRLYTEEGPRAAANFIATINGMSESSAKHFAELSKDVHAVYQINKDIVKEFHGHKKDIEDATVDFLKQWGEFFEIQSNKWMKFFGGYDYKEFFKYKGPKEPNAEKSLGGTRKEKTYTPEEEEQLKKDSNRKLDEIRKSLEKSLGGAKPKRYGGPVEQGQPYLVGERGPELYMGGGDVQIVGMGGPEIIHPPAAGTIIADASEAWRAIAPSFDMGGGASSYSGSSGQSSNQSGLNFFGGAIERATVGGPYAQFQMIQAAMTQQGPGADWPMAQTMNDDERRELDVTLNAEMDPAPLNASAEFTFKNVPPGVVTSMDGEGFDNFKVSKSKAFG